VFVLVFRASVLRSHAPFDFYVSTARVQVSELTHPAFPHDEPGVVKSELALKRAIAALDLNRKWAKQWSRGVELNPDATLGLLNRFLWVELIPISHAGVIEITAYDNDAEGAARLANAVAKACRENRNQARPVVQLMDAAVPSWKPISSFKPAVPVLGAALGIFLGLLAGAAAAGLQARRRRPPS
jgi:hypothetical protein